MNEETMAKEIERLQDIIATAQPGTETYQHYVDDLEHLTKIRNDFRKTDSEIEETKSNLKAQEKRTREETRLREEELRIKRKDAKNKVVAGLITTAGALVQTGLVAHWEDIKPLFGKAWSFIKKIPDRF